MTPKYIFLLIAIVFLTACAHALPHQSAGITAPSSWHALGNVSKKSVVDENLPLISQDKAEVEEDWWEYFDDDVLADLIHKAIKNNKRLLVAKARVEEARANMGFPTAGELPNITGIVKPHRYNDGVGTANKPRGIIDADLQATWEIDIFGRNLPRMAQTEAIWQYQDASQQAVLVELLAELGRYYFDLHNYHEQILITQKNLAIERKTLDLIKAQKQGAIASDFDVARASAEVSITESKIPDLKTAYQAALNRINVLLGEMPGTENDIIKSDTMLEKPLDQRVIVAAPATVLANRPDVKAAERNFAASISGVEYAKKQYFPDINLLTFFGVQRSNLLTATPWSAGLTLTQPIFDFGYIRSGINVATAQQKQALYNYQQKILEALVNMEDALTAYKNEVVRNQSLRDAVLANRKAAELAQEQFKSGLIALLDVLVTERNVLNAEFDLSLSNAALRKDLVNIYTASGGGWQVDR